MTAYQAGGEELLVHDWRVDWLTRLGVPGSLAEVYADRLEQSHGPGPARAPVEAPNPRRRSSWDLSGRSPASSCLAA